MSEDDLYRVFQCCKRFSKKSEYRIQMACFILNKGKCIGRGVNSLKSHPKWNYGLNVSIHAEISAIINTRKDRIYGTIAFIYRETKKGNPALARPCEKCLLALKSFGVKQIIYSINQEPYFKIERI